MLALTCLSLLLVPSAESLPVGTQWTYRGHFVAEKGDPVETEKQFEVAYLLADRAGDVTPLYWISDERGRGSWAWPDRCGRWDLTDVLRPAGGVGPALLYDRAEGVSVVPLPLPLLTYTEPLAIGVSWLEGKLEYRVAAEERAAGFDAWRVDVTSPIGRQKSLWVDKASPLVVALTQTVFIGQGEQHELRWELASRSVVDPDRLPGSVAAFEEFQRLRNRLEIEPRNREITWTAERLALLKADLPAFTAKARGTSLEKLAKVIEQDLKQQKDRSNALGALHGKLVGRPAPRSQLSTTTGADFSWDDVMGKVVVLHFWEYRDAPLEEPYGQVAYLDFLARQQRDADVRVFGVIADERVTQPDTLRAGVQSAKRLHGFMNLSYPLLVDGGGAIKEFGDPRVTGAKLPLYIVIDRQGRIAHYHAGLYEVHRDRGLEELTDVVRQVLDKRD